MGLYGLIGMSDLHLRVGANGSFLGFGKRCIDRAHDEKYTRTDQVKAIALYTSRFTNSTTNFTKIGQHGFGCLITYKLLIPRVKWVHLSTK